MRKNLKSMSIFLIISIALYTILTGFLIYSEKQTNYDRLSNQLYYDNILLVHNGKNINWANQQFTEQYRVYVEVNSNCRILIKDTSKWTPPMLSGYYPKKETGPAAIIGKNVKKRTSLDAQGDSWIHIIEQKFRVTGIVGAEYATSCDDLTILFHAQLKKSSLENIIYIIDIKTKTGAQKIAKSLIAEYPEIQIQQGSIKGTARLTKSSYFYRLLTVELLFITLFTIFIFIRFKHEKYCQNYKVYQICGLPLTVILAKAEIEIIISNIVSLIITYGVGYFTGLPTNSQLKKLTWIAIGITIFSCILESVFFGHESAIINNERS